MEPSRVREEADDEAQQASEKDVRIAMDADEHSPAAAEWYDPGGVQLDRRKVALGFAVLAIAGTAAGVIAYIMATGEMSGRRPGSRITN